MRLIAAVGGLWRSMAANGDLVLKKLVSVNAASGGLWRLAAAYGGGVKGDFEELPCMVYSLYFRALRVAYAIFRCAQNAKVVRPSGSDATQDSRVKNQW